MLRLLVVFLIPGLFGSSEGFFRRVCQRKSLTIDCKAGEEIRIYCAFYGRHENEECGPSKPSADLSCYADSSMTVVREACQGKQSCTVEASNSKFGDPCVGTSKYLEVTYSCVPVTLVQVCARTSQVISCPSPKKLSIMSANFGPLIAGKVCPGDEDHVTGCRAPGSLAKVKADCQGRSSCSLAANTAKFGDPCVGTYKYLEVRYTCESEKRVY